MSKNSNSSPGSRAEAFARRLGIRIPILLAPMSGACPPSLAIAVVNAGGLGACGALLMQPGEIAAWCAEFRRGSDGPDSFQINLWIPDPPAARVAENEERLCEFLTQWGPAVSPESGNPALPDFDAQCQAMLAASPKVVSSIMGLYPPTFVSQMKSHGILWFATATTVDEAIAAEKAGADAIVAQGMEAGGHRGAFRADDAERQLVGLMSLVPQVVDAVKVPVIATGGIADARGIAAALILGASAVSIGTGFLRTPEARINLAYAARLAHTEAHETAVTRHFSGRPGRAALNEYVRATLAADAPPAAPYPVQRGLTRAMREAALKSGDSEHMQMWAGQSAKLAQAVPAAELTQQLWSAASRLLE